MADVAAVPPQLRTTPEPAIHVEGLRHRFGGPSGVLALDGVEFTVRRGETFGLLGPNGAGKTTCLRVVTTLLRPREGRAFVFGHDVARDQMAVRRLIGYVPQQLSADAGLTGHENVWVFARLFDVPRAERRARIDTALEAMGLADAAHRMAATYSGGSSWPRRSSTAPAC